MLKMQETTVYASQNPASNSLMGLLATLLKGIMYTSSAPHHLIAPRNAPNGVQDAASNHLMGLLASLATTGVINQTQMTLVGVTCSERPWCEMGLRCAMQLTH